MVTLGYLVTRYRIKSKLRSFQPRTQIRKRRKSDARLGTYLSSPLAFGGGILDLQKLIAMPALGIHILGKDYE